MRRETGRPDGSNRDPNYLSLGELPHSPWYERNALARPLPVSSGTHLPERLARVKHLTTLPGLGFQFLTSSWVCVCVRVLCRYHMVQELLQRSLELQLTLAGLRAGRILPTLLVDVHGAAGKDTDLYIGLRAMELVPLLLVPLAALSC